MTGRVTSNPSAELPGDVIGKPIRLPHVLCCTNGERHCKWVRVANSAPQLVELMAERRLHEASCRGGLIVVGSR